MSERGVLGGVIRSFGSTPAFWVVVILALVCAVFLGSQKLQPCDDAHITFRHVKNLVEHGRLAWNLTGDPVLGSTSPAFVLALAGVCKVLGVGQIDQAALYLNAVFHFLMVIFTYLVGRDLIRRPLPAILLAALVGSNAINIFIASQGFESAMLGATLLATLYFVRLGRDRLSVVLASAAPLIRPEGILLTPLVWGYLVVTRRFRKQLLIPYFLIPLAWIAFSSAYYGSPIPHAIAAKKRFASIYRPYTGEDLNLVGRLPGVLSHAAGLWNQPAGDLMLTGSSSREFETTLQVIRRWIMLLGLPFAITAVCLRPDGRVLYLLYAPLFLLLYGWIGHTQAWYFPSFIAFSIVLLFSGWVWGVDLLLGKAEALTGRRISKWKTALPVTLVVFLAFITVNNYAVNRGEHDHRHRGLLFPPNPWGSLWDMWEIQRYHYYRQAAKLLNAQATPRAVVMISEVGVIGYYYEGEVFDTVGLCSPKALEFYPPPAWDIRDPEGKYYTRANNFTPTNMIMEIKPDFVVNSRFYLFNLLRAGSPFLEEYEETARFGRVWGEPILIYKRRTSPEPDESAEDEFSL